MEILKSEQEYRDHSGLNYSLLKTLETDPEQLLAEEKTFNDGMLYGKALDILLFGGKNEFDNHFYVTDVQIPSASLGELATKYLETANNLNVKDEGLALDLISKMGLWSNIKDKQKLLDKLTNEFWKYIFESTVASGRHVISSEMFAKICNGITALKSNEYTKKYYYAESNDSRRIQHLYQVPIVFNYRGTIKMKALLDTIVIDHVNKTIRPTDTKTLDASPYYFPTNVLKFRYDLQSEIYNKAVEAYRDSLYPGYKVEPFLFIVSSSQNVEKPIVYKIDPLEWRMKVNNTRTKQLRGMAELISDFIWHSETQKFEYPKKYYEQGFIEL